MKFKKLSQKLSLSAVFIFCFLLISESEIAAQTGSITFVHDPCIIKCNEYYYIFSTGSRIDIRRSADMLNWKFIGSVFDSIPAWGIKEVPGVSNIWAPDIFYHDSTYYLYYALSTFGSNHSCIGLATNLTLDPGDPNYEWIDRGKVIQSGVGDNFNAIDPNVTMDKDNRIWLSFGSFWDGIKMVELDSNTWKPEQSYKLYSIASRSGGAIEAPYIVYKNGYYYLFVSFDYCCNGVNSTYNIRVGRSKEITGPYIDSSGIAMLKGGGTHLLSGDNRWKGPGHCAVLLQENNDWIIFHAYDAENHGVPTLRILPLDWDSAVGMDSQNGWPVINTSLSVGELITIPDKYCLYPNYPNPFNPVTIIKYAIPRSGLVTMKVFSLLGQEVETLVNQDQRAGEYKIKFNASQLASGIYLYRIQSGSYSLTKKMILLK
jgi:arabinan endo-1,5-alpha-L-arabinosidase